MSCHKLYEGRTKLVCSCQPHWRGHGQHPHLKMHMVMMIIPLQLNILLEVVIISLTHQIQPKTNAIRGALSNRADRHRSPSSGMGVLRNWSRYNSNQSHHRGLVATLIWLHRNLSQLGRNLIINWSRRNYNRSRSICNYIAPQFYDKLAI